MPPNRRIIVSKWVFKKKYMADSGHVYLQGGTPKFQE